MPPIPLFSALDTPTSSASSIASYEARCNLVNAEIVLSRIANGRGRVKAKGEHEAGWYNPEDKGDRSRYEYIDGGRGRRGKETEKGLERDRAVARVGLNKSARLVLDIIGIAQRAGKYRTQCREIAESAFQLVNAIDAGVQYHVVDISNVLRDHIDRLNQDLEVIIDTLKPYASHSWWTRLRSNSNPHSHPQPHKPHPARTSHQQSNPHSDPFEKCFSILEMRTELYTLLVSCCVAQAERQAEMRARYTELTGGPLRKPIDLSSRARGKENIHKKVVSQGMVQAGKLRDARVTENGRVGVGVGVRVKEEQAKKPQAPATNTSEDIFNRHRARSLAESDNPNIMVRPPTPPRGHDTGSKLKRQPRIHSATTPTAAFVPAHTHTHHVRFHTTTAATGPGSSNAQFVPQSHYRTPYTVKPIFPAGHPSNRPILRNPHPAASNVTTTPAMFLRNRSASVSVLPTGHGRPLLAPKGGAYGYGYANVSQRRV